MDRTLVASVVAMVIWACSSHDGSKSVDASESNSGPIGLAGEYYAVSDSRLVTEWDPGTDDEELDESCVFAHMNNVYIHVADNKLRVMDELEVGDCVKEATDEQRSELVDYPRTVRIFLEFTCRNVDLAIYDGMTLGEFGQLDAQPCRVRRAGIKA